MCPLDVKRPSCEGFQPARVRETSAVVADLEERERWLENQNSLRGLRVRELLTSTEAIDIDGATASIQYPLRWHHLAVVMWYPERSGARRGTLTASTAFCENSFKRRTPARPHYLWPRIKPADGHGCPIGRRLPMRLRRSATSPGGGPHSPSLAIGAALPGVRGFGRSHRQAEAARGVAIAAGSVCPPLYPRRTPVCRRLRCSAVTSTTRGSG